MKPAPSYSSDGSHLKVDAGYWERLQLSDPLLLCNRTQFELDPDGGLRFRFLGEEVLVAPAERCLKRRSPAGWEPTDDPLLELSTVLYLIGVKDVHSLGRDLVGPQGLREGHFFQGPHELKIAPVLERFGRDAAGFGAAAQRLGGEPVDMAESAWRLKPFPRVHLYYLLWEGDDEFAPRLSVLFDRSIEEVLAADAIWGLVTRVSKALVEGKA
jgi:hypothetical protein